MDEIKDSTSVSQWNQISVSVLVWGSASNLTWDLVRDSTHGLVWHSVRNLVWHSILGSVHFQVHMPINNAIEEDYDG